MSLPKLTAFIGDNMELGNNIFGSIIKSVKKVKENEEPYIVFLVFDLEQEQIYFKLNKKLNENSVYEYFYFGNNSAAESQYYLTRDDSSMKYFLRSTFSDLYLMLLRYNMEDCELGKILKQMNEKDLIFLAKKKGNGRLNLDKFSIVVEGKNDSFEQPIAKIKMDEKDKITINDKQYNVDEFIRLFIDDENRNNKFVLIVPKVKLDNGDEIILSTHGNYLQLVKKVKNLGSSQKVNKGKQNICYICKRKQHGVSSSYSTNFDRTGINKIFTTTTINTSPFFNRSNYDNSYSMCGECYQRLKVGEKAISQQFKSRIAGEDAFIIPEGILETFNYKYLNILKRDVDLAFKGSDAKAWVNNIESERDLEDINQYSINFIIYRTDGNSVTILETIEDVPTIRFEKVMKVLAECTEKLKPYTDNISIGSIYRLIPVKENKDRKQVDIGRVLSLYKAILSSERISHKIFYDYATDGLEKGLKQLAKSRIDNYTNMGLVKYLNDGYEDFFIKKQIFGYITLIKACQKLELLDHTVFKSFGKEDNIMDKINTPSDKVNSSIDNMEKFLDKQGFDRNEKSMFYLGILINRVAMAQVLKEHRTKPILKKIQFQGMNQKEVYRLYQDVAEKLRQYDRMTIFSEAIMNRFHYYYGTHRSVWTLDDHANVFYIMAGYSYMVGSKVPDLTEEEEEANKQLTENSSEE